MAQQKRKKNGSRRRKNGKTKPKQRDALSRYSAMLADPCNALLTPGLYGDSEGLLARLKAEHTFTGNTSNGTEGYVLWLADTTGAQVDGSSHWQASIVGARLTTGSTAVINTTASPAFTNLPSTVNGSGFSLADPAFPIMTVGGVARDCRTISACMKLSYLGPMQSAAGQIATLENIPVADILNFTVDELFRLSTNVSRIGVGTHEVLFRPSEGSKYFRSLPTGSTAGPLEDAVIATGQISATATTVQSHNQGLRAFGFAWRGTDNATNLAMEFIKNIEWRPRNDSGLPAIRSVAMHEVAPVHRAEKVLDQTTGGRWSFKTLENAAQRVASAAFTGAVNVAESYATTALRDIAGGYLLEAGAGMLPLL